MGVLYHGSSTRGLKTLEPRKSTHGTYVYATSDKNIATVFSSRCGDDLVYTFFMPNNKIELIERVPGVFKLMFNNSSSIYSVSDEKFNTRVSSFNELVTPESVDIIEEDYIESLYDRIQELAKTGKITIYEYPNRPDYIPQDDSDLIKTTLNSIKLRKDSITKYEFERLFFLHPNLLEEINEVLVSNNQDTYSPNELVALYKFFFIRQLINKEREFYIEPAYTMITSVYPELKDNLDRINEVRSIDKVDQVNYVLDYIKDIDSLLTPEQLEGYKNTTYINSTPIDEIYKSMYDDIKENRYNKTK